LFLKILFERREGVILSGIRAAVLWGREGEVLFGGKGPFFGGGKGEVLFGGKGPFFGGNGTFFSEERVFFSEERVRSLGKEGDVLRGGKWRCSGGTFLRIGYRIGGMER
jgi:hypothetical protein